jgi:hypothetical protein
MSTGIYTYIFISGVGIVAASDAVTYLNANPFTVSSTQTPVLFEFAKYAEGGLKKYAFLFTGAPGSYGGTGTAVTTNILELLTIQAFLPTDISKYSVMQVTSITSATNINYVDIINKGTYTLVSGIVYLFSFIDSGTTYYKLFTGAAGTYGTGYTYFTALNFLDATDSSTPSDVWATASRRVATSTAGMNTDSGYWTRIASISFSSQSGIVADFSITLLFQSTFARLQSAMVGFSGRQNGTTIEMLNAEILGMSIFETATSGQYMFTDDGFKIIYVAGTTANNVLEIYVKKASTYGQFIVQELARYISVTTTNITYYSSQPWDATEPTGTPEAQSNGLSYNQQKVLTPISAAATYSDTANFIAANVLYSNNGYTAYNIIDSYTHLPVTLNKITTLPIGASVDNVFYFQINGIYYQRNFGGFINAKSIGAGTGANDTALLEMALTFAAKLFFPAGTYYVKGFTIPANVEVYGTGNASILKFYSETPTTDASLWAVISGDYGSYIHDLRITGGTTVTSGVTIYQPGNGLLIQPTGNGMQRSIYNIVVDHFAAYVAPPFTTTDSTYGLNANLTKDQIRGASSVNGGNGIRCDLPTVGSASWELYMNNIRINSLDGIGFDFGVCTDSKLSDFWIGSCVNAGFVMIQNNQNNHLTNLKIDRCFILNPTVAFTPSITQIIPFSSELSGSSGAVILTGANNVFTGLEAQENGSHGVMIGTGTDGLRHTTINGLLVDGNGGINGSPDIDCMRYGLYLNNFYNVVINGVAQDFRSKVEASRQQYGVYAIVNKAVITTDSSVALGQYYKIKAIGTGTDFTKIMASELNPKLNTVGFVFQAAQTANSMGSGGALEPVNDNLTLIMGISDNYDQIIGTGPGYNLSNIGNTSTVIINGNSVVNSALRKVSVDANYNMGRLDDIVAYTSLSAARTVILPPVGSAISNKKYTLKDESGNAGINNITLQPNSSDTGVTIDGVSSKAITIAYGFITVYSNGTQWFTIN